MPYYLHDKALNPETVTDWAASGYACYPDRAVAFAAAKAADMKVYYVATPAEQSSWQQREQAKFDSGQYLPCPWASRDAFPQHFAHQSLDMPWMIAYTPSDEYGYQDRQVRIKPGRYLQQFYPACVPNHAKWITACAATHATLQIATSADDIERIYRGRDYRRDETPFQSCMGPDRHASFDLHPSRVYGDSDLAVAYLGELDKATARAVIYPAKKTYYRAYGVDTLNRLLERDGYTERSPKGARVRAIAHGDGWLMPYIDGCSACELLDNGWICLGTGPIACDSTNGSVPDGSCGYTCDHCSQHVEGDEDDDVYPYCQCCHDEQHYCESCDENCWNGAEVAIMRPANAWRSAGMAREWHCQRCIDHHDVSTCAHCEDEWNEHKDISLHDQQTRLRDETTHLCEDCANLPLVTCHACGVMRDTSDEAPGAPCPDCGIVARCEHTPDMLDALEGSL